MNDYVIVYCNLEPKLQESKFLMQRIEENGFVASKKNRCLFYKRLHKSRLGDPTVGVSYYYYVGSKRGQYHSYDFSARKDSILEKLEWEAKCKSYNYAGGYVTTDEQANQYCSVGAVY